MGKQEVTQVIDAERDLEAVTGHPVAAGNACVVYEQIQACDTLAQRLGASVHGSQIGQIEGQQIDAGRPPLASQLGYR